MSLRCADCGTELPDGARFCFNCGQQTGVVPAGPGIVQPEQTVHGPQTNVVRATGPVLSGTFHIYQGAPERPQWTEDEFERVLNDYLTWVWSEYRYARLHGLQTLLGSGPHRKPLAEVYTSLRVSQRPAVAPGGGERELQEQTEPVDMAKLLTLGQRVAIVGGAGCGKTTYLAFVAASLAAALGGASLDKRLKPHRPGGLMPIPFLAPLRFWNVYRQEVKKLDLLVDQPNVRSLKSFLLWYLRHSYGNFHAAGDFFERLLSGGGGLIMFDGLDEVVSREERLVVRDAISRLLDRPPYQDNLCLVTAREAGYRDAPFGNDFVRCDVQPMDEGQIAALVEAWCHDIPKLNVARDLMVRVIGELNQERRQRGQEPLVSTPLMVTMVVSVYYSKQELPRERAKLYDAVTDVILQSQYSEADEVGARRLVVTWGEQLPPDKQREWLALLAFNMHRAGEGAVLDENGVRDLLTPPLQERGELDRLGAFVTQARSRGGLFEERGEIFQFMHLTFQEYLAGQYLAGQWRDAKEHLPAWVADGWWREVLLLTVGSMDARYRSFAERSAFITHLLTLEGPAEAQMAAAELAASGLLDLGQAEGALCEQARERLVSLLTDPHLSGVSGPTRAAAGRALSAIGDPRPGVLTLPPDAAHLPPRDVEEAGGEAPPFPDLLWRPVPGGILHMGSAQDDEFAYKDEHGPGGQPVPVKIEPFFVAAYPITNAQFRPFVQGDGYTNPAYWTPAGWGHKERENWSAPRYWDDPRWNLDNHPVVGVSWYEAVAYCKWANEQMGKWANEPMAEGGALAEAVRHLPLATCDSLVIRLPTEAEWEWVARGPGALRWPWGDEWEEGRCNSAEAGVGRASAVGAFPGGAARWLAERGAPVHDLAGNVREWCATRWQDRYPLPEEDEWRKDYLDGTSPRVWRGGSFGNSRSSARGAARYGYLPGSWSVSLGFRVVAGASSWQPLVSGPSGR